MANIVMQYAIRPRFPVSEHASLWNGRQHEDARRFESLPVLSDEDVLEHELTCSAVFQDGVAVTRDVKVIQTGFEAFDIHRDQVGLGGMPASPGRTGLADMRARHPQLVSAGLCKAQLGDRTDIG